MACDFSSLLEESKGHSSTSLAAEISGSTNVLPKNWGPGPEDLVNMHAIKRKLTILVTSS